MNLGASAVVLRPRGIAEILDLACALATSRALGLFARLACFTLLPGLVLCVGLRHVFDWHWAAVWAVAIAWGSVAQGAFTIAVGRLIFSEALTARRALALFAKRLPSYLGATLLSKAILAASGLVFFVLTPVAWPRIMFVHEACLLEGAGAGASVSRANAFVNGRAIGAFGLLLALLFTQGAFVVVAELLGDGLMSEVLQLGKPLGSLLHDGGSVQALVGLFASFAFVATARFLGYIDQRTRTDGWDVQLRFMAIAARAAGEDGERERGRERQAA